MHSFISLGQPAFLILNVLNCFEDYKRCIHISYHILDFIQQKKIKFTMEQSYVLPILYCQCHACWCTGDFRSQCINRHGIDFQSRNIPSLAWEELTLFIFYWCCYTPFLFTSFTGWETSQGYAFCEARRASHCHGPQTTYASKSTCCAISAQNPAMHVVVYAGRLTSQRSIVEIMNW